MSLSPAHFDQKTKNTLIQDAKMATQIEDSKYPRVKLRAQASGGGNYAIIGKQTKIAAAAERYGINKFNGASPINNPPKSHAAQHDG